MHVLIRSVRVSAWYSDFLLLYESIGELSALGVRDPIEGVFLPHTQHHTMTLTE